MAIHPIRVVGDPVLSTPTRPVTDFDDELRTLVADMYETMAAANGVGLAANQIGVDRRVFVYDCPDDEGNRHKGVVVNPTLETSARPEGMPDPDDDFEGCLSVPGETYPTGRADWAKVTGFDDNGEPVEVEGTGFFARCLQHETDHLDGLLYLDRLVGRNARAAKKMLKRNGWGVPGLSWDPAVEPDPFADEDDDE
ncbi:MAG TPA: peptide deformylase [Kutzneria sp.]|jgi:peptide deformylase|nr:peptide deformylase [Kutzneria sp.]